MKVSTECVELRWQLVKKHGKFLYDLSYEKKLFFDKKILQVKSRTQYAWFGERNKFCLRVKYLYFFFCNIENILREKILIFLLALLCIGRFDRYQNVNVIFSHFFSRTIIDHREMGISKIEPNTITSYTSKLKSFLYGISLIEHTVY